MHDEHQRSAAEGYSGDKAAWMMIAVATYAEVHDEHQRSAAAGYSGDECGGVARNKCLVVDDHMKAAGRRAMYIRHWLQADAHVLPQEGRREASTPSP